MCFALQDRRGVASGSPRWPGGAAAARTSPSTTPLPEKPQRPAPGSMQKINFTHDYQYSLTIIDVYDNNMFKLFLEQLIGPGWQECAACAPPRNNIFKNTESLCSTTMYCTVCKSIRYLTKFKIFSPVLLFTDYFTKLRQVQAIGRPTRGYLSGLRLHFGRAAGLLNIWGRISAFQ